MALHLCRDFYSTKFLYRPAVSQYLMTIFAIEVLGYALIGQTTFNILSNTFKKAYGSLDCNIQTYTTTNLTKVLIPAPYVLSISDVNRILVLKSNSYPTKNSGLFRILSIDTSTNEAIIDYRSPDDAPTESGLSWSIYEEEQIAIATFLYAANSSSNPTYRSAGNSTCSRTILQSPDPLQYRVRFCLESVQEYNNQYVSTTQTVSIGFGGDAAGDWSAMGDHTHRLAWFNRNDIRFCTCGFSNTESQPIRFYAWGDDTTGVCTVMTRGVGTSYNEFVSWGYPEFIYDTYTKNSMKLFVYGNSTAPLTTYGDILYTTNDFTMHGTYGSSAMGWTQSNIGQPISVVMSSFVSMAAITPWWYTNSAMLFDSLFTNSNEIYPLELVAGTIEHSGNYGSNTNSTYWEQRFPLEFRVIGRPYWFRHGRHNYNQWSVSSNLQWMHTRNGVYMPWNGPNILP